MTIINRMIRTAKANPPPTVLELPRHLVRQVAEHSRLSMQPPRPSCDELERMIVRGEMCMLGIPVRVIGRYASDAP